MEIISSINNGITTLSLDGKLDTLTSPKLSVTIEEIAVEADKITLDFIGVSYVSSAGLRALLSAHKLMQKKEGELILVNVNETVLSVLKMTSFDTILSLR